jgi:Tfp pilus assembly protein PilO
MDLIGKIKKFDLGKLQLDNQKIALIIAGCLILAYLDYSFIMKLQIDSVKKLTPKIVKLRQDLDSFAKNFKKLQEVKKQESQTKENAPLKRRRLISENEITSLLQYISDAANKDSVKIMQIKPSKVALVPKPGAKQSKQAEPEKFTPLLFSLDLFAGYHNLGRFINDLENSEIFISVEEIKILSQEKDIFEQKVNFTLKTYVKK